MPAQRIKTTLDWRRTRALTSLMARLILEHAGKSQSSPVTEAGHDL
jgi:hypothetical protein